MEPMLLEDYKYGQVPQTLRNLLKYYHQNGLCPDKNDIVVGLVYLLMIEAGFVPRNCSENTHDCDFNYQRLLRHSSSLPYDWKHTTSYQLEFILKSAPNIVCSVICLTVSDDLLINCTVKNVGRYSLLVDPLAYLITTKVNVDTLIFQNLDHLARMFKNVIAFPAKTGIVSAAGGICPCFQHMPHELLIKVMSYLKIPDVMNLAQTCKTMCYSAQDSSLWVKLLAYEFRKKNVFKTYEELKFLYEIKYARELSKILAKRSDY